MPHHLDLYLRHDSPVHRLDARAKSIALAGFLLGVLLAPRRPAWALLALALMLAAAMRLAWLPIRTIGLRLMPLALVIGLPFAFSRLGGEATRAAGVSFAAKSFLVAAGFLTLMATTRAIDLLEIVSRAGLPGGLATLLEFIYRGVSLLSQEVVRTNRACGLRASAASPGVRLSALAAISVSLLGRAAARSERVGAAMALRGFDGRFPAPPSRPLPRLQFLAGTTFGVVSLLIGAAGAWL
jgi:cobalt/nickel transport system permease protein